MFLDLRTPSLLCTSFSVSFAVFACVVCGLTSSAVDGSKAFAIRSGVKAAKQMQRRLDKEQKKLHAPAVDRTPVIPAPYFVAVVGPSGVSGSCGILHRVGGGHCS